MLNSDRTNGKLLRSLIGVGVSAFATGALALNMGDMASSVTSTFSDITHMITGGSYLAGLGFSIAASFLFLPSILSVAGYTMFGKAGTVSMPSGTVYS